MPDAVGDWEPLPDACEFGCFGRSTETRRWFTTWRTATATIGKTPGTFPHTHRDARGGAGSRPARVLFPAPPPWLQKVGRFRGTAEDSRGFGDGVESCSYQQFAPETRVSRDFPKLPLRGCNSRRLHHSTRPLSGPRSWQATRAQASARCPDRGPRGPSRVVSRASPKGESRGTIDESRREFTQCRRSLAPPSSFDPASPTS